MVVNRTFISVTVALVALNVALVLAQQPPATPGLILPKPRTQPAASSTAKPVREQPQAQAPAPAGEYVGQDTCVACHEDKETSITGTPHAQAKNPRSPAATHGCESCHGPGKAHAESGDPELIQRFTAVTPAAQKSAACLSCHNRGNHAGWEGSAHDRRDLSCSTCHSVHSPKSKERQLVQPTETQLCATCHRLQVTKTERAVAHMPVREGKMSCSSCHNPHGSISNVKNLKTGSSVAELCTSCHTEMRGPMLFEHAPVRENCATCHDPHGSSNDRMLVVRMPMLCQRCHIASRHPATLYDKDQITTNKSNRMFGRSCVNCHSDIHGSNHPSGQFFMR
ncbi:MAG TPA: DmsE family decaheme c-type cytochrome [Vicinamibacterales bacterium]|jgi:DmsE family decaheme c-type cytochrome